MSVCMDIKLVLSVPEPLISVSSIVFIILCKFLKGASWTILISDFDSYCPPGQKIQNLHLHPRVDGLFNPIKLVWLFFFPQAICQWNIIHLSSTIVKSQ